MPFEVKPTDIFFYDSPFAGDANCLCSRCGKHIEESEPPVRCWPDQPGEHGFDPLASGGTEFRYCRACVKTMGITFMKSDYGHL